MCDLGELSSVLLTGREIGADTKEDAGLTGGNRQKPESVEG